MFNPFKRQTDPEVTLVVMDGTGHSVTQHKLSTLTKQEVMRPDRTILVNGKACDTWEEVLQECRNASKTETVEVSSILKMAGG